MNVPAKIIGALVSFWFVGLAIYIGYAAMQGGTLTKQLGPTAIGMGAFALFIVFGAFHRLVRTMAWFKKVNTPHPILENNEPVSAIDADAVIERYLANRPEPGTNEVLETAVTPRRSFGRKGI